MSDTTPIRIVWDIRAHQTVTSPPPAPPKPASSNDIAAAAPDQESRLESAIERRTRLLRDIADLNREITHMKAAVRVAERLARAS